jgi:hypothetical protein
MSTQLLRDAAILPTPEVIEKALGDACEAYQLLSEKIKDDHFQLTEEWRYYNDGKAWLCKVVFKKKTVFWLSVWEGFFMIGFYFADKYRNEVEALDIDAKLLDDFRSNKNIGKLLPLNVAVDKQEQIDDLLKIISMKKRLK